MIDERSGGARLALLLPSKGRFFDLFLTLALTPMRKRGPVVPRFVVCANYPRWQLSFLESLFSSRADFIDERRLEFKGMVGAYNYAFARAQEIGAEWVALWADDLLPARPDWVAALAPILRRPDFSLGIFSSDEGNHKGRYGFNIFAGYPCAHFFVARSAAMPGHFLNPSLRSYTADNEICIDFVKRGLPVHFLPIKVMHQPTSNTTRRSNNSSYKKDLDVLYTLHPELVGKLDDVVLRGEVADENCAFVADEGSVVEFERDMKSALRFEDFLAARAAEPQPLSSRLIWLLRRLWNEWIVLGTRRLGLLVAGRLRSHEA